MRISQRQEEEMLAKSLREDKIKKQVNTFLTDKLYSVGGTSTNTTSLIDLISSIGTLTTYIKTEEGFMYVVYSCEQPKFRAQGDTTDQATLSLKDMVKEFIEGQQQ